ncbi:CATRA system-associated protein, partial [Parafrankia sp. EUN1f]
MSELPMDLRREALAILRSVPEWELTEARWSRVIDLLAAMESALDTDGVDLDAVSEAVRRLETCAPPRITPIGSIPAQTPQPPVRERVGRLIHKVSGAAGSATTGTGAIGT